MPFITGAKDLIKMFPHMGVPYQVWIDKNGKLLQVAEDYDFTKENIAAVLSNNVVFKDSINKPVYKETLLDTTYKKQVQFASYLVRYNEKSGLRLDGNNDKNVITASGSIIELYQRAYDLMTNGKFELLKPGRLVLDVKDSAKYINTFHGKDYFKWKDEHDYYYQLIVPEDYAGNLGTLMAKDLDRYFGLDAKIEEKLMPILVLTRIGKADKLKSKGGNQIDSFNPVEKRAVDTGPIRYLINQPYKEFSARIQSFSEYTFNKPFKDLTGYDENIDIEFKAETLDHPTIISFKSALHRYGLDLEERMIPIQVLILKERD